MQKVSVIPVVVIADVVVMVDSVIINKFISEAPMTWYVGLEVVYFGS